MVGLIYKEFVLQRRSLIILGIVYGILTVGLFLPAGTDYLKTLSDALGMEETIFIVLWEMMIFLIGFIIIIAFQSTIFEVDENKKWAGFITSTPLAGKGQVGAKYYFTLLLSVLTLVWVWLLDMIATVVFQLEASVLDMAVLLFYLGLLLHAIEFPFVIRFGSKGGKIFQEIFFPILIYGVIIYFLFGDISAFGSVNSMLDSLFQLMVGEKQMEKLMPLQAVIPYLSVAGYAFSYWLSGKLYVKGVETYAK